MRATFALVLLVACGDNVAPPPPDAAPTCSTIDTGMWCSTHGIACPAYQDDAGTWGCCIPPWGGFVACWTPPRPH